MRQYTIGAVCTYATLAIGCGTYTRYIPPPDPVWPEQEQTTAPPREQPRPHERNPPAIAPQENTTHTLERILFTISGTTLALASALAQYRERPTRPL